MGMKSGQKVTIRPAYEMATKAQTRMDEFAGRAGKVVGLDKADVLVELETGSEVWVHASRLEAAS